MNCFDEHIALINEPKRMEEMNPQTTQQQQQIRRRKQLLASIIVSIFISSCISGLVVLLQQQQQRRNRPSSSSVSPMAMELNLNPKLPSHIQALIIQARADTDGDAYNVNNSTTATAIRRIRGSAQQQSQSQPQRNLASTSTSTANNNDNNNNYNSNGGGCISFWHISILPSEHSTCTNSGHYPPEWSHTSVLDYMFHASAEECCTEMLRPWTAYTNTQHSNANANGGIGASAVSAAAVPTCNIVNHCTATTNANGHANGNAYPTTTTATTATANTAPTSGHDNSNSNSNSNSNNSNHSNECTSKLSFNECIKRFKCGYDTVSKSCVPLQLWTSDGLLLPSTTTIIHDNNNIDTILPHNDNNNGQQGGNGVSSGDGYENNDYDYEYYYCKGKSKKACVKDKQCQFITMETTTTTAGTAGTGSCVSIMEESLPENKDNDNPTVIVGDTNNGPPVTSTSSAAAAAAAGTDIKADTCNGLSKKVCIKSSSSSCSYDAATDTCQSSSLATTNGNSPNNNDSNNHNSSNKHIVNAKEQHEDKCQQQQYLYHPTSILERTCSNNNIYPSLWVESQVMMERYFFQSGHDCCAAFYNDNNNNRGGSSGEGGGGPCLIEDVCKSTTATATTTPEKNGNEGTTTNNGMIEKGEQDQVVKISKWQQQDDYCKPKKKKLCVKDEACKWFYDEKGGGSCLGYWENENTNSNSKEKNGVVVGIDPPTPAPAPLPTPEESVVVDCDSQKWHESQVEGMTCTNDGNYPTSWDRPRKQRYYLFSTSRDCCETKFGQRCNVVDTCSSSATEAKDQGGTATHPTPLPYQEMTPSPTTSMPRTTNMPTQSPETAQSIMYAKDGSIIDPSCYYDKEWHVSRVPGDTNKCTNDKRYPDAWLHPALKEFFLFATIAECCEANFDDGSTTTCEVHDVCIEGTTPPTAWPTASIPTYEPTTALPTVEPTPVNMYETAETTCTARWHISNTKSNDANNSCTNDSNYPKSWNNPSKRDYFLFPTAQDCCKALFSNGPCKLYNICPFGATYSPTEEPTTAAPISNKPTEKPTRGPSPKPSRRPTWGDKWYIDRMSGKCVQDCAAKYGEPCGGEAPEHERKYNSGKSCCNSMPWTAYEVCLTTPSPTGPPEPTISPIGKPTPKPSAEPTKPPTPLPTTAKPTKAPTPVPTVDCSIHKWHMSVADGEDMFCTNDANDIPSGWLENPQFFFHDDGPTCCQKVFGGNPNCGMRDWCAEMNKDKMDESEERAQAALAAEAAAAAAVTAAAAAAEREKEEAAAAEEENQENNNNGGYDQVSQGGFAVFNGGKDDFEGGGAIPWLFGSPPEWTIDSSNAYSGQKSVTNIPTKTTSATTSLKLEINIPHPGSISCKAKVGTSMPFDRFSVHINGVQRKVFYQPEQEDWINLATGLAPGDNEIEFRVTNGDMFPDFDRAEAPRYSTGHVWMDECDIRLKAE